MVRPTVDDTDRDIIEQLRIDGRMPFAEIGRNIGVSEPTVRARYARLVSLRVVHVAGVADQTRLGGVTAHIGIRLANVGVEVVADRLARLSLTRYVACALGNYDIIMDVEAPDLAALGAFVLEQVRTIHGIAVVDTLMVHEVLKDSYDWKGLRDGG